MPCALDGFEQRVTDAKPAHVFRDVNQFDKIPAEEASRQDAIASDRLVVLADPAMPGRDRGIDLFAPLQIGRHARIAIRNRAAVSRCRQSHLYAVTHGLKTKEDSVQRKLY